MGGEQRTPGGAPGRLPDFLIIGAMRAGSTSLARNLAAHPRVFMPAKKELHFFDWNWDRGIDWYRNQFRGAPAGAIAGEATPIYVVYREAMERIAAGCPDARLLVIVRNPVDRAYSHYRYNEMLGFEQRSFADALAAETIPSMTDRRTFDYVARGRYAAQLETVSELFSRDAFHVLLLEDLEQDPATTYGAACRFLGIDDSFVPADVDRPLNAYAQYRSKLLSKAARALPASLARATRRLNRRETRYEDMTPAVRRQLEERFAPENAALAARFGLDLSAWAPAHPAVGSAKAE